MTLTKLIWQQSGSNSTAGIKQRSSHSEEISQKIKKKIDQAILDKQKDQEPRKYLGASSLGDACSRKIQYRYMGKKADKDKKEE